MKKLLLATISIVLAAVAVWVIYSREDAPAEAPYVLPALTQEYKNDTYQFSLNMPGNFIVREVEQDGGVSIVLEDAGGNGIQLTIVPFDEDIRVLTKERIEQDVPDLAIRDLETLEVGDDYKGLAFKSDNDAFDGDSREVWFIFRGNFYQISTYARLDSLLKAVFATWKFF